MRDEPEKPRRTVRLPFDFGERVYHRVRTDKVPGIVTGYNVGPFDMTVRVTWGDDLREFQHYFFELTTDFEPDVA